MQFFVDPQPRPRPNPNAPGNSCDMYNHNHNDNDHDTVSRSWSWSIWTWRWRWSRPFAHSRARRPQSLGTTAPGNSCDMFGSSSSMCSPLATPTRSTRAHRPARRSHPTGGSTPAPQSQTPLGTHEPTADKTPALALAHRLWLSLPPPRPLAPRPQSLLLLRLRLRMITDNLSLELFSTCVSQ